MKDKCIYKIINTINNKFYVGSTTNKNERFRTHRKRLRNNTHHTKHLQAAWNKYGEQAFVFHVIEIVQNEETLESAEQRWLNEHVGKDYCYNTSKHVNAPWRGINGKNNPNYGKKHSDETKELIKAARANQECPRKGSTHTEETKELIRQKKLANPTRAWLGKTRSEETRQKIGDTQRGKPKAPGRKVSPEGLAKIQESIAAGRWSKGSPPKDFAAVLDKFPQEVKDKYDFTGAVYTGALERIKGCQCAKHGEFSQYAAQFRKGRGCPTCGAEERAESKRKQMKEFWSTEEGRNKFINSRSA